MPRQAATERFCERGGCASGDLASRGGTGTVRGAESGLCLAVQFQSSRPVDRSSYTTDTQLDVQAAKGSSFLGFRPLPHDQLNVRERIDERLT
jgi:hypothetical protein